MSTTKHSTGAGVSPKHGDISQNSGRPKPRTKKVLYKERNLTLYSIAWLKYFLNRDTQTIRIWEWNGIFPRPIFNLNDKQRWYCADEILGYTQIFQSCKKSAMSVSWEKSGFPKKCADFNAKLRIKANAHPEQLAEKLPEQAQLSKIIAALVASRHVAELSQE